MERRSIETRATGLATESGAGPESRSTPIEGRAVSSGQMERTRLSESDKRQESVGHSDSSCPLRSGL